MTYFGLKQGQSLENRAAHRNLKFRGVTPIPGLILHIVYLDRCSVDYSLFVL